LNIFKLNGIPSEKNPFLFNGDFVDRGSFSVEIMLTLLAWKVHNPNCIHLTRGNHETKNMNKMYGFEGEVVHKYDAKTMEFFSDLFCCLPLCYILNK
jgi:serine/threonine-protein phosphatase 5